MERFELLTRIIDEYVSSAICLASKNVQFDFKPAISSNINVSSDGNKLWQTKFGQVIIGWSVECWNRTDGEGFIDG